MRILPIHYFSDAEHCVHGMKPSGYRVVATALGATCDQLAPSWGGAGLNANSRSREVTSLERIDEAIRRCGEAIFQAREDALKWPMDIKSLYQRGRIHHARRIRFLQFPRRDGSRDPVAWWGAARGVVRLVSLTVPPPIKHRAALPAVLDQVCKMKMERVKGIEPSYSAWKAAALPLSYTRRRRSI